MKYWNKPFVLEIYIRVTKNCIYTIKIGYALTLIQKSYVKSPLGFLSFQTCLKVIELHRLLLFQSPLGFLSFQTDSGNMALAAVKFQSPLGFLSFQTATDSCNDRSHRVSIPFGVSILPNNLMSIMNFQQECVSIPFGVSILPNSISAIPVFMRAKLVICGEESFFRNISTENPLKMPLSPVFMRCAVKFIFSFIAFIYYNGNFL